MIGGQRTAERRMTNSLPEDRGLQKSSTYIVPCFLFVEVSCFSLACGTCSECEQTSMCVICSQRVKGHPSYNLGPLHVHVILKICSYMLSRPITLKGVHHPGSSCEVLFLALWLTFLTADKQHCRSLSKLKTVLFPWNRLPQVIDLINFSQTGNYPKSTDHFGITFRAKY